MKKILALTLFLAFVAVGAFAQNEAYRNFVPGTSLFRQEGSPFDRFPRMEIGLVGRHVGGNRHEAVAFLRFQSESGIGGGALDGFTRYFPEATLEADRVQAYEGSSIDMLRTLLASFHIDAMLANMRNTELDRDLGEITLTGFMWLNRQGEWMLAHNSAPRSSGTVTMRVRARTVGGEHRLYFSQTAPFRDQWVQSEAFALPTEVFLTQSQVNIFSTSFPHRNSLDSVANIALSEIIFEYFWEKVDKIAKNK